MGDLPLTIVAAASGTIGAGHVMRCAVLGAAWRACGHGPALIRGAVELPFVRAALSDAGVVPDEGADVAAGGVVLVDSYDPETRRLWASATGAHLRVLVDDLGEPVPVGYDAVWNPNPFADAALYPGFGGAVVAGPAAVPLRAGLPRWAGAGSGSVGVTLGGSHPGATLVAALDALSARRPDLELRAAGAWVPGGWRRIPADALWPSLARCGAVVTAAGSTLWEAAAVGVPVVALPIAANQERSAVWARAWGVPVVAPDDLGAESLAVALEEALARACPLPPLSNGAPAVAGQLAALAARGGR